MAVSATDLESHMRQVGRAIKRCRQDHDLTQGQLSKLSRVSRRTIIEIEAGRNAYYLSLYVLSNAMGMTFADVLDHYLVPAYQQTQNNKHHLIVKK